MHIHTCRYNTLSPFGIACMYICPSLSTLRLDNLYDMMAYPWTKLTVPLLEAIHHL